MTGVQLDICKFPSLPSPCYEDKLWGKNSQYVSKPNRGK
jgi:hypothetical protein